MFHFFKRSIAFYFFQNYKNKSRRKKTNIWLEEARREPIDKKLKTCNLNPEKIFKLPNESFFLFLGG